MTVFKIYFKGFESREFEQLNEIVKNEFFDKYLLHGNNDNAEWNDEEKNNLLFLRANPDQKQTRLAIWKLLKKHRQTKIVLCSSESSNAHLAWQTGIFYFLKLPFSTTELRRLNNKIRETDLPAASKIKFNHKNGFTIIEAADICFCKSDGNYTEIYLTGNKKILVTRKLKELEEVFRNYVYLTRIGRGHIINLNRIARVNHEIIIFEGMELPVRFSAIDLRRIKSELLWFT
jgi:DNA-binding LytR/AlgR family response regulator